MKWIARILIAALFAVVILILLRGIGGHVNDTLDSISTEIKPQSHPSVVTTNTNYGIIPPVSKVNNLLRKLRPGEIAFNTPRTLDYGKSATIRLLISPTMTEKELIKAIEEEGEKEGYKIQISKTMKAELTGDAFNITSNRPDTQPITDNGATSWSWDVRPRRAGKQKLHLTISAIIIDKKDKLPYVFPSFDKIIEVKVPLSSSVDYFQDNWAWIVPVVGGIGGVIGALVKLFSWYRNRKKQAQQSAIALQPKRHRIKKSSSV